MDEASWSESEANLRQSLEQHLREKPGDRGTMIALGTLLATKKEFGESKPKRSYAGKKAAY